MVSQLPEVIPAIGGLSSGAYEKLTPYLEISH